MILLKLLDSKVVLMAFTGIAMACLFAALFMSGPVALIALPLIGFFAAVMYPTIFSLALNSVKEHHRSFSGIDRKSTRLHPSHIPLSRMPSAA